MFRRLLVTLTSMACVLSLMMTTSGSATAAPLTSVVSQIQAANGVYRYGAASLPASDCSGLVSVAQSLAMNVPIKRWGHTASLLAGQWPYAIPGATPEDLFVIGVNRAHMSAAVGGVNIESTGGGYRVGPQAKSPWDRQYIARYHIDPKVLVLT